MDISSVQPYSTLFLWRSFRVCLEEVEEVAGATDLF